jgi:polar amino acid transport system substrate-binding protein
MKYVEERRKARTVDEAASTEQNLRKLMAGRIDTFVNAVEPAMYAAQRLGLQDQIKVLDWVAHDGHYFTAVSKKSRRIPDRRQFLKELDSCLAQLKKDGSFCAIYRDHGLTCPDLPNRP